MTKNDKLKSGKEAYKFNSKDEKILKELVKRPEGMRIETIQKLTQIPNRTIYRRLNKLSENKLIENIFPIWRISNGQLHFCQSKLKNDDIFELHNISYVVKLIDIPIWWAKRKNYLIRLKEWQFKNIDFGKGNSNPYQQLINENFVIQCYPESLIIIAKKRYYADDPYTTIKLAINDVISLLEWFCERFKYPFFKDGIPHIEIRNNDFNRMKDFIANKVRDNKGNFLVEVDKRRKVWVDLSEPFGKEANYPEGQEILEKVTKDYLINKPMLNSELQNNISILTNAIAQTQTQILEYRKENIEHLKLVKQYRKENIAWRKNESIKLTKNIKSQKVLGDYYEPN